MTAEDAYATCIALAEQYAVPDDEPFHPVTFEEAEVVHRTDGNFWVWAEYETPARPDVLAAVNCILGGTLKDPMIHVVQALLRDMRDEYPPDQSLDSFYYD